MFIAEFLNRWVRACHGPVMAAIAASAAGPASAEETGNSVDYYRAPRSYATTRETEPPRYVRNLDTIGVERFEHAAGVEVGLDFRARYEYRDGDWRRPSPEPDQPLMLRARAYLGVKDRFDPFRLTLELEHASRRWSDYSADTRDVNAYEPIQAYAELYFAEPLQRSGRSVGPLGVRVGRMAFELLDRRLVGRNEWRNTTNTFQGVRALLGRESDPWQVELMALEPILRSTDELDRPARNQAFYVAVVHWRRWSRRVTLEPYYMRLQQSARPAMAERDVHSVALRAYGGAEDLGVDFDVNVVAQVGEHAERNHRAWGLAAELGHTFDMQWQPRASLFYGYGSGEDHTALRGSRRFERYFGFARPWSANDYISWENVRAIKLRIEGTPRSNLRFDAGLSYYRLADETDGWRNAGLADTSGASGDRLGSELDGRLRYRVNRRMELTGGYARFRPGSWARRTSGGRGESNFVYFEIGLNAFE
jgi:hypothetical protein